MRQTEFDRGQQRIIRAELEQCWKQPSPGRLKINVDGAWTNEPNRGMAAGVGVEVRDCGEILWLLGPFGWDQWAVL